ncbi:MAG: hypothetical protein JXB48_01010 [Candidatus Latescibacteria bacterium]|nr:hypothetical protein [Candidatus Latescibacterota bacterium]
MGYESINKHTVRVIAAFAMRPKVVDPGDKKITVKINDTLFAAAQVGGEFGIPVLAGVPLVNSLTLFSVGVPCDWFLISESSQATVDCEFMLTLSKQPPRPTLPQNVKGPLTQMELVDIAQSCCHEQDWMRAEVGIRLVKNAGGLHNPIFGGGYRPFFLLMISNQGKIPKNISAH